MKLIDTINKKNFKTCGFNYPYIIAEAGVNHEGDIKKAINLIRLAAEGGADAIKFQTYKAGKIASKNSPYYWDLKSESTQSQYQLFKKYDKFWKKEYELLHKHCQKNKIEFISTPFDKDSAKFLNDLMPVFKISSSDLNNKFFIDYLCTFSKPIILSTGASNMAEIKRSVNWIKNKGIPLALLHCILNYPTLNKNANLGMIKDLQNTFEDLTIGYSDHTLPNNMEIVKYAAIMGAKIIEKHFTYDKNLPGNDHYHSMDVHDLKNLKNQLNDLKLISGSYNKKSIRTEQKSRLNARRSLVASKNLKKGTKFSYSNLTYKRPGTGVPPSEIDHVIGKISRINILKDDIIESSMIRGYKSKD